MAAYRRVYDSRHLQADCREPGLAPERNSTREAQFQNDKTTVWIKRPTQGRVCHLHVAETLLNTHNTKF